MKLRHALLIFGLILAGCSQAPASNIPAGSPAASSVADNPYEHGPGKDFVVIEYDSAAVLVTLDLMRGHLVAALENARIEDYTFAQQHAALPLAEHYEQIKDLVQENDAALDMQLDGALKTYQQQLAARAELATIEKSNTEIKTLLDQIEGVLVPIHTDVHSRAIAGVVQTAAEEYAKSIKDGAFAAPMEYQNAFGFTRVAAAHFARLKPELNAEAVQTSEIVLDTLAAAMPSIQPPQNVIKPASDVTAAARSVEEKLGPAPAAGMHAAALEAGLNRLATSILPEIDTAIDKSDVAAAHAAWEAFDGGWSAIEDGVRERSQDSYRAIEEAMSEVEDAVVRTEQPSADAVKVSTASLRAKIETFVQTLK